MPRGGKDETTEADDVGPTPDDNETFGQALSRAGFEPAKVGRKIVSQGKRRETLRKRPAGNTDN